MSLKIEVTVSNKIPNLEQYLDEFLNDVAKESTETFDNVRKSTMEPKTGRIYGTHQASAPGEPWANMTFNAYNSIAEKLERRKHYVRFVVDGDAPYLIYLEDGTYKMAPRPTFGREAERLNTRLIQHTVALKRKIRNL